MPLRLSVAVAVAVLLALAVGGLAAGTEHLTLFKQSCHSLMGTPVLCEHHPSLVLVSSLSEEAEFSLLAELARLRALLHYHHPDFDVRTGAAAFAAALEQFPRESELALLAARFAEERLHDPFAALSLQQLALRLGERSALEAIARLEPLVEASDSALLQRVTRKAAWLAEWRFLEPERRMAQWRRVAAERRALFRLHVSRRPQYADEQRSAVVRAPPSDVLGVDSALSLLDALQAQRLADDQGRCASVPWPWLHASWAARLHATLLSVAPSSSALPEGCSVATSAAEPERCLRTREVVIGDTHRPPRAAALPSLMAAFFDAYTPATAVSARHAFDEPERDCSRVQPRESVRSTEAALAALESRQHPLGRAVLAAFELVWLHPWTDANGRAAQLLMAAMLQLHGWPLVFVPIERKEQWNALLALAHPDRRGDTRALVRFFALEAERALEDVADRLGLQLPQPPPPPPAPSHLTPVQHSALSSPPSRPVHTEL